MEEPPEHNWYHRGINAPKNGFLKWEAWIRIFLSFICGTLSAAFLLGGKSRDISDLQSWKETASKRLDTIQERFERMDKEGTNRSHWTDDNQSQQISANQSKLVELERKSEQRGEQINVMQGKIERLERELEVRNPR